MLTPNTTSINITGNIKVTVPASPKLMTTYILSEQHDWFEDEIKFIRFYIKPGMKVVDVGANYGCYSLSIAGIIGDSGRVWAIEPTDATASCLRASIELNKFTNVDLIQAGLSIKSGHAELFTSENSELNSLSDDAGTNNQHETIKLLTLDQCMELYGWNDIDFIKLDAEGEEINILKGGESMLASMSPLIMFELKHGSKVNIPLIEQFSQTGYNCYRLIPGLNILVPFDHTKSFDSFLLNLFCCKNEKAKQLEEEGFIVREFDSATVLAQDVARQYIDSQPFSGDIIRQQETSAKDGANEYLKTLTAYIMAMQESTENHTRIACIMQALDGLHSLLSGGEQDSARLATLSRIAFDAGERQLGVELLRRLLNKHGANINFKLEELFLPASSRYEGMVPGTRKNEWMMASIIEQSIKMSAYSTFFTRQRMVPLFDGLNRLGYMNEDMQKRYRLVQTCFPQQTSE